MQNKLDIEEIYTKEEITRLIGRIEVLEVSLEETKRIIQGLIRTEFQKMREMVLTEEFIQEEKIYLEAPLSSDKLNGDRIVT